jgi:uncharacterized protein YjaG (DUF416 family)
MIYDETGIIKALEALPQSLRAGFAGLCAERLVPLYAPFAERTGVNPAALASSLTRLWRDLEGEEMTAAELQEHLDTCLALFGDEEKAQSSGLRAYAADAAAAVAYALGVRQNGSSQEAACAARRVYEALDYFVNSEEATDTKAERFIADPLIQTEINLQWQDLDALRTLGGRDDWRAGIAELRRRSSANAYRFLAG